MILAAGRGERLRPLTDTTPKPLLEVGGETLIERHLNALAKAGFRDVVINVSHLGNLIESRLRNSAGHQLNIAYSREPGQALETAGGIARALPLLGSEPFLVINADIWTDFDLASLRTPLGSAHLVVTANPPHHPDGDFGLDGQRITRIERNPYTYCGIGIYRPALFRALSEPRARLAPLLFRLAADGALTGEVHYGRWFDIGTPERLAEARAAVG